MMDKFEKQFDDLDVRSAYMEGAMGEATSTSTPQSEVDSLVGQVAAKAGLDLGDQLASAGAVGTNVAAAAPANIVVVGVTVDVVGGGGGGGVGRWLLVVECLLYTLSVGSVLFYALRRW